MCTWPAVQPPPYRTMPLCGAGQPVPWGTHYWWLQRPHRRYHLESGVMSHFLPFTLLLNKSPPSPLPFKGPKPWMLRRPLSATLRRWVHRMAGEGWWQPWTDTYDSDWHPQHLFSYTPSIQVSELVQLNHVASWELKMTPYLQSGAGETRYRVAGEEPGLHTSAI